MSDKFNDDLWYEEEEEEEEDYEEPDTTLENPEVIVKFKQAGQWANEVMQQVMILCVPGANIHQVCCKGDELIEAIVQEGFEEVMDRGISFPTTISVNEIVCHWAPSHMDTTQLKRVFKEGDVARIDLGVQLDWFPALVAQTIVITRTSTVPTSHPANKVIGASMSTLKDVATFLAPPSSEEEECRTTTDASKRIEACAAQVGLKTVDGVLSHEVKNCIMDSIRAISSRSTPNRLTHEYTLEDKIAWCLDICLTNGAGLLKESTMMRPGIFKVALDSQYGSPVTSSQKLMDEVSERYVFFPFAIRNLHVPKQRLALADPIRHGLLIPFPVLQARPKEVIAQFKATVLVHEGKAEMICGGLPLQEGILEPNVSPSSSN